MYYQTVVDTLKDFFISERSFLGHLNTNANHAQALSSKEIRTLPATGKSRNPIA
jgi:hypothetical protein